MESDGDDFKHLNSEEFSAKFYESEMGKSIVEKVNAAVESPSNENASLKEWVGERYKNSWLGSLKLLVAREMLLWWRDKSQIKARLAQGRFMNDPSIPHNQLSYFFARLGNGDCCWYFVLARARGSNLSYGYYIPIYVLCICWSDAKSCTTVRSQRNSLQTPRCELLPDLDFRIREEPGWAAVINHRWTFVWFTGVLVCGVGA